MFSSPANGGDPRTVVSPRVWRGLAGERVWEVFPGSGGGRDPGWSEWEGLLCHQGAVGSRTGCLEILSPWSLDLLTFPASEEAVYSQKVIHSLIRSTSLLTGILTSCPGEGSGGDSSTQSPVKSV